MRYVGLSLSPRNVGDLLNELGVDDSYESVRYWWHRFDFQFARKIKKRRAGGLQSSRWKWHLDEVFVKINRERHYLWFAVDHEGEVLESYLTKKRDNKAVLNFMEKAVRRYGSPDVIVTDKHYTGRWANNGAQNSYLPLSRLESAMLRFRRMHSLQMFASIHASFHDLFNSQRSLSKCRTFKLNRDAALNEWGSLIAS